MENIEDFKKEIVDEIYRKVLLTIPSLVIYQLEYQSKITKQVEQFYSQYPELKSKRHILIQIVNAIQAKEPELSVEQVFAKAAGKTKELVNQLNSINKEPVENYRESYQKLFNELILGD